MAVLPTDTEPVDSTVSVTSDGGVSKKVLKPGSGPQPPLHARCLVHYVGKLKSTGEIFMDTRAAADGGEPKVLVAGRDSSLRETGLNLAVATMQQGEICALDVKPKYGYGSQGSFSFPTVPPNADLGYEMELITFDEVDEGKERSMLTYEERLEAAERRRLEGNRLFEGTEFTDALGKYAMALSFMDQDFMIQLEGLHEAKANAVRLPTLLNMAACHLQLHDYNGAISAASQVLAVEADNAKALFRRGRARHLLGQSEAGREDLRAALRRSPKNPAIVKELQTVERSLKAEQKAADELFRGSLAPAPQQQQKSASMEQRAALKPSSRNEQQYAVDLLAKGCFSPIEGQNGEEQAKDEIKLNSQPSHGRVLTASSHEEGAVPLRPAAKKPPFWSLAWESITRWLRSLFSFVGKQRQSHAHVQ